MWRSVMAHPPNSPAHEPAFRDPGPHRDELSPRAGSGQLLKHRTHSPFGFLLFGLESPADPEHVAIRMAKVHLADVPRHIGGRKCDLQPGGDAMLVHLVHIVHPDRHPDALVASRSITPNFHRKGQLPMFGL